MSDDLISRQAAIDAVGSMLRRKYGLGGDLAEITLKEVPTTDVVPKEKIVEFITNELTKEISERLIQVLKANYEIIPKKPVLVRCKDCKWFNDLGCALRINDESDKPKGDDFCSFGERREDE